MIYNEKWLQHLRESSFNKLDKIDLQDLQQYYVGEANKLYKKALFNSNSTKKTEYINKTYNDLKTLMGIKRGGLKAKSSISRKQLETNIEALRAYVGKESGATDAEIRANFKKGLDKAYDTFQQNHLYDWTKDQFADFINMMGDMDDLFPDFDSESKVLLYDLYEQQPAKTQENFFKNAMHIYNNMMGKGYEPKAVIETIINRFRK